MGWLTYHLFIFSAGVPLSVSFFWVWSPLRVGASIAVHEDPQTHWGRPFQDVGPLLFWGTVFFVLVSGTNSKKEALVWEVVPDFEMDNEGFVRVQCRRHPSVQRFV